LAETIGEAARAVRGIEAAAGVLRRAVDAFAVGGGEGARRLADALTREAGGPPRLEGDGIDGARAALGASAAGKRVALLVSGDAMLDVLPAIREMVRLGLPVVIVVPSHGPDIGASLPAPGLDDLSPLASLAVGVLVAADVEQVPEFLLAALRAATDRSAPWVVAFELATVGVTLANARVPADEVTRSWVSKLAPRAEAPEALQPPERELDRYVRGIEQFGFAVGAAMRDLERIVRHPVAPVIAEGAREPEIVLIALGSAARAARQAVAHLSREGTRHVAALQIASLRPFPAADVVRLSWRARAVIVHEALCEPLGVGGSVSDSVRASFADALTWHPAFGGIGRIPPVVTLLGVSVSPEHWLRALHKVGGAADPPRLLAAEASSATGGAAESRLEIAMNEAEREAALRLAVDWLARAGTHVTAHATNATRATIAVGRGEVPRGPTNVLLVCSGAVFEPSHLERLATGSAVVLAGDFSDRVLAETMRAAALRGVRVATLHAQGAALRPEAAVTAVIRLVAPADDAVDRALDAAVRDLGFTNPDAFLAQVRAFAEALRAQFA
jgi:pyruvate/2-oxoacid:ferredoxin oxidoreductase alpha subunit